MESLELAVRRYGRGEPLLLLHGLFGSASQWHHIAVRLAATHRVLAVDLRNHGASSHAAHMDYPALADDVRRLLDVHGLAEANVLGHSMGGKVAMCLALRAPERVRRLAVVDIAPVPYEDEFRPLVCAALGLNLEAIGSREDADRALAARIPSAALRAMLLQNLVRRDGAWTWRIAWTSIAANLPALSAFPPARERSVLPALFVRGGNSDYVLPQHQAAIAARFPHARCETIDGAGHWVQADRPRELVALMQRWLA
jgi:esterase